MGKTKLERRPTTRRILTPATQIRLAAMNAAAPVVTQAELCNLLEERGQSLNRSTVGFILYGGWYNENVAQALADLTDRPKAELWPDFLDEEGKVRPGADLPAGRLAPQLPQKPRAKKGQAGVPKRRPRRGAAR